MSRQSSLLFVGFALVTGCVLRCWNISQSFWWDEIWSTMTYVNAPSIWQVLSSLGYYFNNHIFYSLLARGSIKILGESEFAARLPALIMGLLAILMLFYFGRRFLSKPAGVVAPFLLALSAFHIDHSSEARGYAGLALFSILSSFYFLKGLRIDERRSWIFYVIYTVLGFYSHVFMIAVLLSQFSSSFLFVALKKWLSTNDDVTKKAFGHFLISSFAAGITTLLLYSPVLATFFNNMGKVRFVDVNRIPFVMSLLNSFFPGVLCLSGGIVYSILLVFGLYGTLRKDPHLFIYLFVMLFIPLFLYLFINPMFVFERYFIFALPFALLVVSQGMVELTGRLRDIYKRGVLAVLLVVLVYLQYPAIATVLNQDRQNYRDAVYYVENESRDRKSSLIFTLGYAGEHFRYYARNITIYTPETLADLSALVEGKEHIWCLVTAWLPDIRPPHEDKELYAERPGQIEIYNSVKEHFTSVQHFPSRYAVDIYYKHAGG